MLLFSLWLITAGAAVADHLPEDRTNGGSVVNKLQRVYSKFKANKGMEYKYTLMVIG
jgi:hypothetical protein